jgi:plasmid stabilization system protein ParE
MRIRYTVRASADLAAIRSYLQERNPRAAAATMAAIRTRIGWLADFPLIAPETDEPGVRALPLVRYPYRIYTRSPVKRSVLHIRHTRRQPWRRGP